MEHQHDQAKHDHQGHQADLRTPQEHHQQPAAQAGTPVHARFRLNRVTHMSGHYKAPGEQSASVVEGAYVELGAVQGEPFGSATPSGSLSMGIVNPSAAKVFLEAKFGQEFDILISPVKPE